ncbi:MAG: ATP-binding cassette domain-containing protein [Nitriliruptoraceae bacterium]
MTDTVSTRISDGSPRHRDVMIRVEGVVRRFGDVVALAGVDLAVERGTVFGLLGPNGAGKTTLVRVLATLLPVHAGSITIAGVDALADPMATRARIGLAGQFAAVDEFLTGRENVEMVGRLYGLTRPEARRRAADVLERIGLTDDATRRVGTYSGGMRRRLDLAASLVGRPQVLFLDEPTTGIDPRNRIDLWEIVEDLVGDGTTVLLTTQYLEEADRLADRIAVIDHGRIIGEGTADELKSRVGGAVIDLAVPVVQRQVVLSTLQDAFGSDVGVDRSTGRVRLPARNGSRSLTEVARALDAAGFEATDLALHRPTLDDVFMSLTGQPAGEIDVEEGSSASHRPVTAASMMTEDMDATPDVVVGVESSVDGSEPARARLGLRDMVTDSLVIGRRNLTRFARLKRLVLFSTVQPVMFLLLFTFVFGGAIGDAIPGDLSYLQWLMPGLLIQVSAFGAGQTAIGLAEDLSKGVVDRFRSLPMARSAVLVGRTLADVGRNAFVLTVMLTVGTIIGFRISTSVWGLLGAVALSLLFFFSLTWVMATIGLKVQSPEAVQTAVFLPTFPFVFASSVFAPTSTMPGWLRVFAEHQPITAVTNALRSLMLGPQAVDGASVVVTVAIALAWIVGIVAVFSTLAVRTYRRAVT